MNSIERIRGNYIGEACMECKLWGFPVEIPQSVIDIAAIEYTWSVQKWLVQGLVAK